MVHPVGNASTIMESFKDKFNKFKISNTGENIIAFRKFGHKVNILKFPIQQNKVDYSPANKASSGVY